jgi:phage tail sheath protein FI
MASTELLASKVVILEEEPQIPAIAALPSAVLLVEGVCERGPINDPQLVTSFSEYVKTFGGFTTDAEVALAAHGYFTNGGGFAWVNRIVHYTDLTDPAAHNAAKGQVILQNSGTAATPGSVDTTATGPFNMIAESALTLVISIDGGGPDTATITAVAATLTSGSAETYNLSAGGETLTVKVDRGPVQTVTFQPAMFAAPAAATAAEVAAAINAQLLGASADVDGVGTSVEITSDRRGSGSYLEVTGGTANAGILDFSTSEVDDGGASNVSDLSSVTGSEIEAIVEGAVAGCSVTVNGSGTLTFATTATGSAHTIQIDATSGLDTFLGLDNAVHTGADAAPENTLQVDGKYFGAYTDTITITIEDATSGDTEEFNLKVLDAGVVKEVFPNVTMDDAASNFAETVINDENFGSDLIAVTDLDVVGTTLQQRPANGTSAAMSGGDDGLTALADADYQGNAAGPTGLYAFDRVASGTMLVIPDASANVQLSMLEYAANWRNGSIFVPHSIPQGYTAAQAVAYVTSNGLLENSYGEFGAIYWPRIKVSNPQPAVFGDDDLITVDPAPWIAGAYARNDQKIGGIYESPAGIGGGFGVIDGMRGVEDDPGGQTEHAVLDERTRDLVYPKRINPITKLPSTGWHIDGGRTLKSTGNFPNVGERRGVIFIEQSIKQGLIVFKHRYNNKENRKKAERTVKQFLIREMNKDAFRSRNPAEAFFVDAGDQLNPLANVFAGVMTMRVGLATNKPNEFIVVLVTQDTRGLADAA